MNTETITCMVIVSIVALVMVIIGFYQLMKKDAPVGFYNLVSPPKKEEITDIVMWNRKHGAIWIIYGVCIELGFWLGLIMPTEVLQMIFMIGGIVLPLPFMVIRHKTLVKKYGRFH